MAIENIRYLPANRELERVREAGAPPRLLKALAEYMMGPRADIMPRKGSDEGPQAVRQYRQQRPYVDGKDSLLIKEQRLNLPGYDLLALANRDDIVFSIRRTLKNAIGELDWKIVPDLDKIKDDLKNFKTVVEVNLAFPGFELRYQPQAISNEFFVRASGALRDILRDEMPSLDPTAGPDVLGQQQKDALPQRLREFFENCLAYHEAIAGQHAQRVHAFFEHPNPSAESSFRALLNKMVDDITLYDAVALVKNATDTGALGELYTLPADQIRLYRRKDLRTPQPPLVAYDWYDDGGIRAVYNNAEIVYMMANEQPDGYGKPPVEVVLEQMVGSLYGDAYLQDWFANNNMPPFVFDLGPGVMQSERDAIEEAWDQRVRKGKHRGIFIATKEGVKGFVPLSVQSNKDADVIELLKHWAARKCAAWGLSLNDIGFTEDLHRTTSETQAELTQSRGVNSLAITLQGYLNGEVVKGSMWVRDKDDPTCMEGRLVPVFPGMSDVLFKFITDKKEQKIEDAQRAAVLVDGGVLTRNEVRHEMGLPPREGGDVLAIATAPGMKVEDLALIPVPQQQQPEGQGPGEEDGGTPGAIGGTAPPPPHPPRPAVAGSGSNGQRGKPSQSTSGDGDGDVEKRLAKYRDVLAKALEEN